MEALLSKPFQTFEASLKSLVRMLPLTKSRGAFKIFSRRISVLNLSSGRVYTAALASSGAGPLCPLEARPSVAVLALVDMVQTAEQGSYLWPKIKVGRWVFQSRHIPAPSCQRAGGWEPEEVGSCTAGLWLGMQVTQVGLVHWHLSSAAGLGAPCLRDTSFWFCFFFLAAAWGLQDPSSPIRDHTLTPPCSGSVESHALDCQKFSGVPPFELFHQDTKMSNIFV